MPSASAHRVSSSDNSMPAPILLDGSETDAVFSNSALMTRTEVIARRGRRAKQLARIYRDWYWALMEELKLKYRQYCWDHAKSPFVEDEEMPIDIRDKCGFRGCKANAMAMAKFCHAHILSDTEQTLYKACVFSVKSSNSGPRPCGKPTLRSVVPSYCSTHFQQAKNLMTCALRKGGLNVSSTSKLAPKFHSIVEEYVQEIQKKRKAAQRVGFMRKGNNSRSS